MSEFGFIASIAELFASLPSNGFEGIGDDCAVLPVGNGESLLFTSDMLNEGVHFLRHAASPAEIGAKSLTVNLSDIAAMGGRPVATLLSIALPADVGEDWAAEFMRGYRDVAERFGVALVGGDTTRSQSGVVVDVTAIGRAADDCIKRRRDARAGDVIMVGDLLGASAEGLRDILAGRLDTATADVHRNPQAQICEGEWLGRQRCVHAMMDISDGVASDLVHILRASAVGAVVEKTHIPAYAELENAVCGGEDYKLLFTVAADLADDLRLQFEKEFGYPIFPIGRITADNAGTISWLRSGEQIYPSWHGFTHF